MVRGSICVKSTSISISMCCNVVVTQINYPSLNKQDSIEQARGRSHKKGLVQIFMLYDMQFEGGLRLFRL